MTIKEQTCTAEQGARLVELGVKPVATFYHMPAKSEKHGPYVQYGWSSGVIAPAYNVAELGDMLPAELPVTDCQYGICLLLQQEKPWRERDLYHTGYIEIDKDLDSGGWIHSTYGATEAHARAEMLIHLLENNLMTLPSHWRQDPNDPCADGRCKLSYSKDWEEIQPMPVPTDADLKNPKFMAMWEVMKTWTIHAPAYYKGYKEAYGRHVKLLLDAQKEVVNESDPIPGTMRGNN